MATLIEALAQGISHQRADRLSQAETIYREILRNEPGNPDALHLLGLAAHQAGNHEAALSWIEQAVVLRPAIAAFQNSLGTVLQASGRTSEASTALKNAIRLDPALVEARVNLGNLLQEIGRPEEAIAEYCGALALRPETPEIHNNLGNTYLAMGRREDAVDCFRDALRLRPDYPESLVNLAGALQRLGQVDEAERCCRAAIERRPGMAEAHANLAAALIERRRWEEAEACCLEALRLRPGFAEALCNLGNLYTRLRRYREAETCCREALLFKPGHAESWNNLGNSLKDDDRLEEAVACYHRALELRPKYADAHANLGVMLCNQGKLGEAMACYEAALGIEPAHADARLNRAFLLLLTGRLEEGWEQYEWRWKRPDSPPRACSRPQWNGESLAGRTILVTTEQGLGDTIQFARYLPMLEQQGARVLLDAPAALAPLLRNMPGTFELTLPGMDPPEFDFYCPLLSLPRFFGVLPGDSPYLSADPDRVEYWRVRLASEERLRVGLVWAGNPQNPHDRQRSIPVDQFRAFADVPGVALFSLQQGANEGWAAQLVDHGIADLAAILMNLDVVITVDTMMAHLAGALGRPAWILLSAIPDWRWLLGRDDSPWYQSVRLFRQEQRGDWAPVIRRVRKILEHEAQKLLKTSHHPPIRRLTAKETTSSPTRCRDLKNRM